MTGVVALTSLIALSLGLYLWWPRGSRVSRKLSPSPWRATFFHAVRLHGWLGIWTLLALLVLIASGLYLAQPGWVDPALALLPDTPEERAPASSCRTAPGRRFIRTRKRGEVGRSR